MNGKYFIRSLSQFSRHPFAQAQPKKGAAKLWKGLTLFVCFPIIGFMTFKTFILEEECSKEHERPKFVRYDYLRIRNRKFPWGDGNHSFFHNPHLNALPTGYEDEE